MERAECDIRPAVLSHDQAAIQQLEAYLASADLPNQAHVEEDYIVKKVPSPTKLIQKYSEDEFRSKVAETVSNFDRLTRFTSGWWLHFQGRPSSEHCF